MKTKITIITLLLLLAISVQMQAQSKIFDKLSEQGNITTVYISKSMLGMAPDIRFGKSNIKDLAGKLDQIEIYTGESKNVAEMMNKETELLVKDKSYEVLMKVKEGKESTTFYGRTEGTIIKEVILVNYEEAECNIIRLLGNFTSDDMKILAK